MGKRKHSKREEEYIERKIRKLEKKKLKLRRKYSKSSSEESCYSVNSDYVEKYPLQEDSQYEETPEDNHTFDLVNALHSESGIDRPTAADTAPRLSPAPAPALASVVNPVNQTLTSTDVLAQSSEPTSELEPEVLSILGEEPITEQKFGPGIQKDLACRWSDILVNGLKNDTKKEIISRFEVPENLKLVQAPALNAEIKAASNENILKRDNILLEKQKLLATVITGVGNTISNLLTSDTKNSLEVNKILKPLSDAGRLLCHIHFSETMARRTFLLSTLSKEVKDNVKDLKRDGLLFGNDLQEKLRSMKAITKTGAELKPLLPKPKPQPRNKPSEASTSRALNWRGAPAMAAPPPPPRRTQAKQNSSSGGRKKPPPPRRANEYRAPLRQQGRGPNR